MKHIYIIVLLLITTVSYSQIKLEGVVRDSLKTPLELANIVAINQETNGLESYAITDEKGNFSIKLSKNTTYNIQVSYIGQKTFKDIISTKEINIRKDYTLFPDNLLDEVEIVYEMPVLVKGDTLIYNADSFKNGSERKLGDVLKKLPGVEINENGQIEVEGKVVNKLMVNGKDFLTGIQKLLQRIFRLMQ